MYSGASLFSRLRDSGSLETISKSFLIWAHVLQTGPGGLATFPLDKRGKGEVTE
jgi:hypothetical protein